MQLAGILTVLQAVVLLKECCLSAVVAEAWQWGETSRDMFLFVLGYDLPTTRKPIGTVSCGV